jgi:hypothetical protein
VFKLIVQVLLAFLIFMFRNRGKKRRAFDTSGDKQGVAEPDYGDLTPYDIEDAEYEDLPKRD